jgi:AraC-like DNA-binding protein
VPFPLSSRTFQRKLSEESLSFRRITDDIKKELSIYLAKGNKMKTQDTASILGYSEASSYLHAAKKWELN